MISTDMTMRLLPVNLKKPQHEAIKEAYHVLKRGGVVVYPTDTCYGLAADIYHPRALEKVFKIKKREAGKLLSIIVEDLKMIKTLAQVDETAEQLIKKYLPGKLTIVLPAHKNHPPLKGILGETVGFRIPGDKVSHALMKALRKPITATSSNLSGQPECYSAEEVVKQFEHSIIQPDLILDGGTLPKTPPSTVALVKDGVIKILREGPVIVSSS